ncbi:MAG: phosphoserine phosphatase SerB [Thermoprotei archaeon]|nr:MAG: phosphoserine phosphatase SerB [Thermoprotei archaeon]RLF21223.1 MAG: phosphoserine phosphatase SerB [Thermoprotei archaeon]
MSRLVVTVVGYDRPGIVAGIAEVIAKFNGNIVRAKASQLLGLFVMTLVVDLARVLDQEKLVEELKQKGLQIGVGVSAEKEEEFLRTKRLIAFDMDGTVLDAEAIDEIAKLAGVEKEVAELTKKAMEGLIDFEYALRERVKLLKGLPVKAVEELADRLPIVRGVDEMIRTLKEMGFITVLITGGFDIVAKRVAEKLGFDYWFANKLGVENGKLNGEVEVSISGGSSKLEVLRRVAEAHGIDLEECIAVGDGANDLVVIENVGLGIGFRPKPVVEKGAKAVVNVDDLRVILAFIAGGRVRKDVAQELLRGKRR